MSARRRRSRRELKRTLSAGLMPRTRPDKALQARGVLRRWGLTPATAYAVGAIRHPDRAAIIDEHGALSFAQVHRRTDAIASSMRSAGIGQGDTVAILCANHRGLIEASVAASKRAANVLYLRPESSAAELQRTLHTASPRMLICDEDHADLLAATAPSSTLRITCCEPGGRSAQPTLEELAAVRPPTPLEAPATGAQSRFSLAPPRPTRPRQTVANSLMTPSAVNCRIPLRPREATMIAAPMIEPWGFAQMTLAMRLASTVVLRRRFDPIETLALIERHEVTALALTPDMLARIVGLPRETLAWYRTSLRVIAVVGPALPCDVAIPAIERFGDILYNLRGRPMLRLDDGWPLVHPRSSEATPARTSMAHTTASRAV